MANMTGRMAIPGRLELPTCGLGNRRFIRPSYGTANQKRVIVCRLAKRGASDRAAAHGFKDQQTAIRQLGTVDTKIIEVDMTMERREGLGMSDSEIRVEVLHPRLLNGALGGALAHSGAQIMDDPMIRESHVAGKRLPLDEDNSLLVVKQVRTAKIDKGRDVELRSRLVLEPRS